MRRYVLLALAGLAGCGSAPTRENAHAAGLVQVGQIEPADTHAMTDCLLDAFGRAHWALTNTRVSQQRRTEGARVETYTGNMLLVSADVMDDGKVSLTEMSTAKFINTQGERAGFAACLARYVRKS